MGTLTLAGLWQTQGSDDSYMVGGPVPVWFREVRTPVGLCPWAVCLGRSEAGYGDFGMEVICRLLD